MDEEPTPQSNPDELETTSQQQPELQNCEMPEEQPQPAVGECIPYDIVSAVLTLMDMGLLEVDVELILELLQLDLKLAIEDLVAGLDLPPVAEPMIAALMDAITEMANEGITALIGLGGDILLGLTENLCSLVGWAKEQQA